MIRIKKIFPILMVVFSVAMLAALYLFKNELVSYTSIGFKGQLTPTEKVAEEAYIDSMYNYSRNGLPYRYTFLEFGATGCAACRKMEFEMEKIRIRYPDKVQVVFINVMQRPNQTLMKYFGISAIPSQVLLDKEGNIFFTHTGFLSAENLSSHFK